MPASTARWSAASAPPSAASWRPRCAGCSTRRRRWPPSTGGATTSTAPASRGRRGRRGRRRRWRSSSSATPALRARLRRRWAGSKAAQSWRVARAVAAAGRAHPGTGAARRVRPPGRAVVLRQRASSTGCSRRAICSAPSPPARRPSAFPRSTCRCSSPLWDAPCAGCTTPGSGTATCRAATSWSSWRGAGEPPALYLVDLNRARVGRPPTVSERSRDLCRLMISRDDHQELFLAAYWGGPPGPSGAPSTGATGGDSCSRTGRRRRCAASSPARGAERAA